MVSLVGGWHSATRSCSPDRFPDAPSSVAKAGPVANIDNCLRTWPAANQASRIRTDRVVQTAKHSSATSQKRPIRRPCAPAVNCVIISISIDRNERPSFVAAVVSIIHHRRMCWRRHMTGIPTSAGRGQRDTFRSQLIHHSARSSHLSSPLRVTPH